MTTLPGYPIKPKRRGTTKPNIGCPTYLDGTVGSRDAAVERTGRYSQRVPSRYVGYLMYSLVSETEKCR
jgi:hypothetical protein